VPCRQLKSSRERLGASAAAGMPRSDEPPRIKGVDTVSRGERERVDFDATFRCACGGRSAD